MTQEEQKKILDEIWRLNKKADQNRSFHNVLSGRLRFWNTVISLYVTIGAGIGTTAIFAKIPDEYFVQWGILSASVFLISLIPSIFNFNKSIEDRTVAVNLLGKWVRDAQNFGNIEIIEMTTEQAIKRQKELVESYKEIMDKSPNIPDNLFLKLKQNHLQKVSLSIEMEKYPFLSLKELKDKVRTENKQKSQNNASTPMPPKA